MRTALEPLQIDEHTAVPTDCLSMSFVRDLGGESTPDRARTTPTSVELRMDATRCGWLQDAARERLLAHPMLMPDRRGTVRLVFGEHNSRGRNLQAARELLATAVREAIADRVPQPPLAEEVPRRGTGAGLTKGGGRRRATRDTADVGKPDVGSGDVESSG